MGDTSLIVRYMGKINIPLFKLAIDKAIQGGLTRHAPLGSSGNTIYLYYKKPRSQEVSVRLHNHNVEMLITNTDGKFLFYGKFSQDTIDIANEFYRIFRKIKPFIIVKNVNK